MAGVPEVGELLEGDVDAGLRQRFGDCNRMPVQNLLLGDLNERAWQSTYATLEHIAGGQEASQG